MSSPTNWKKLVEKTQAATYTLPEGWTSRETVAEQLGCSVNHVRTLMAPAIKARSAETKPFPVWDPLTKRVIRVTAYRQLSK